jgi:P-type Ca2+ transporter type 2C
MTEHEQIFEQKTADFVPWHTLSSEEVFQKLQSGMNGLSETQTVERQHEFGRNILPAKPPLTLGEIILHQFKSPLIYILLVAGLVSLLIGDYKETIFIFLVVTLNAAIGAIQERKAERSAAALQSLLKVYTRVRRAGSEHRLAAEELVPGDIVLLESGNRVPADLRLIQVKNLTVDESFLTGESLAVAKQTAPLAPDIPINERTNILFAGATVTAGRGVGIVVATGLQTEVGMIAGAVTAAAITKPPLVIRMERFARQISVLVLGASAILAVIALGRGIPYTEVFFLAVALAVSAIPEGLPVALTVALAIGTSRMAQRNAIVRKLTAVEGLGSCTYIASDKTGTLTVNKQTVRQLMLPSGEQVSVSGEGYSGDGAILDAADNPIVAEEHMHLERLALVAIRCNEAGLTHEQEEWHYHGDAVDVALLAFAYKLGLDPRWIRRDTIVVGEIPFESERRYAARLHRDHEDAERVQIAVKGAVETVLPFCTTMLVDQQPVALDGARIEQQALALSQQGYRVIAVAHGEVALSNNYDGFAEADMPPLTLLGLVGLIDPLRPEVKLAVDQCRRAGIEVAMITGDHPATALAIARELGIATDWDDILTGRQLEELGEVVTPELLETIKSVRVFARVTPLQKLQIVEALIKQGHFVAVTGDGVNDAPALRAANIGVAMGSGTDVAKDTAAIIVTDDNFASIEAGVEEGRFAYDNIRKVTYLLISTGAAEVILFTLATLMGLPLPLFAVQLLWLNLVTNGIQDVALAFEGGEPGAMQRPPRSPAEGIFNPLMIRQTLVSGATIGGLAFGVWVWLLNAGYTEDTARNLLLLLMVLFENFHVFNCRSEYISALRIPLRRNPFLIAGVTVALGLHLLAMHVPFMQAILSVAPVAWSEAGALLLVAAIVLVVMEIFKLVRSSVVAHVRQDTAARRAVHLSFERLFSAFLLSVGLGLFVLWAVYLERGTFPGGLSGYPQPDAPIIYLVAGFLMSIVALAAGVGVWLRTHWGHGMALFATGLLTYAALNFSGWALHNNPLLLIPVVMMLIVTGLGVPYLLHRIGKGTHR